MRNPKANFPLCKDCLYEIGKEWIQTLKPVDLRPDSVIKEELQNESQPESTIPSPEGDKKGQEDPV
jgi:hypothetical protein